MEAPEGIVFSETLSAMAEKVGAGLSSEQVRLCSEHARLMLEWNRRMNLTRITDPLEIVTKHFLDSLAPARWLPRSGRALDVGSGPGFPGAPLKVLYPDLDMVLLETQRKKIAFLTVLLSRLGLEKIRAVQGRWQEWEKWGGDGVERSFRLIVMRAVRVEAEHLSGLAAALLEPGGLFAWWGGPEFVEKPLRFEQELEDSGIRFLESFTYTLPGSDASRRLVVWRREEL